MKRKELNSARVRRGLESPEAFYREALRYYENARKRLRDTRVLHNRYQDPKIVSEACGTCYLAVLLALDGYLLTRGVSPAALPKTTTKYWASIKKRLAHNGRIQDAFNTAWDNLHVGGYYRGFSGVGLVKEGFKNAKWILDTLSKVKPKR